MQEMRMNFSFFFFIPFNDITQNHFEVCILWDVTQGEGRGTCLIYSSHWVLLVFNLAVVCL